MTCLALELQFLNSKISAGKENLLAAEQKGDIQLKKFLLEPALH